MSGRKRPKKWKLEPGIALHVFTGFLYLLAASLYAYAKLKR